MIHQETALSIPHHLLVVMIFNGLVVPEVPTEHPLRVLGYVPHAPVLDVAPWIPGVRNARLELIVAHQGF